MPLRRSRVRSSARSSSIYSRESFDDTQEYREGDTNVFRDGERKIDFVLVYVPELHGRRSFALRRRYYQRSLMLAGLQIEMENSQIPGDRKVFVNVHAPMDVLSRQAELMDMKLAFKLDDEEVEQDESNTFLARLARLFMNDADVGGNRFFRAVFRESMLDDVFMDQFETYFTDSERSVIVWEILTQCKFGLQVNQVGIRKLLNNKTYVACYPLHESNYKRLPRRGERSTDRYVLYHYWASFRSCCTDQPYDVIKRYFGDEVALYYAWLGLYTKMLVPASIVGVLCMVYGLVTWYSLDAVPSLEICSSQLSMCPRCQHAGDCGFPPLSGSCFAARFAYLFDNPATVFFAVFMSFWATTLMELWKRYLAFLTWRWGLANVKFTKDDIRPEYELVADSSRYNRDMRRREPDMTFRKKAWRMTVSWCGTLFVAAAIGGFFLSLVVYKITAIEHMTRAGIKKSAGILAAVTAACINLCFMLVADIVYQKLARLLTNYESPRTNADYEGSFTFKVFVFEFINFYSLLVYIAFFKGKMFTFPGDHHMWNQYLDIQADQCEPAGCLVEVFLQLSITLIGRQVFNNFYNTMGPLVMNWWKRRQLWSKKGWALAELPRWEQDFHLAPESSRLLFVDQQEMAVQYGFLTLFVAAFPLAPLATLINNLIEVRLGAFRLLTQTRRTIPRRVHSLGAWTFILQTITYIAVVSNACVIAFTSDFIPRMVYRYNYRGDMANYTNWRYSVYATKDYGEHLKPPYPDTCVYRGFRYPPHHPQRYELSFDFWYLTSIRFAFVLIFEHFVLALTGILAGAIPDVPQSVRDRMAYEYAVAMEARRKAQLLEEVTRRSALPRMSELKRHVQQATDRESIDPDTKTKLIAAYKAMRATKQYKPRKK